MNNSPKRNGTLPLEALSINKPLGTVSLGDLPSNGPVEPDAGHPKQVEELYTIGNIIGKGTSGTVVRAREKKSGKHVAIKTVDTRRFRHRDEQNGMVQLELFLEIEILVLLEEAPNVLNGLHYFLPTQSPVGSLNLKSLLELAPMLARMASNENGVTSVEGQDLHIVTEICDFDLVNVEAKHVDARVSCLQIAFASQHLMELPFAEHFGAARCGPCFHAR